jgi:hypothetical protein
MADIMVITYNGARELRSDCAFIRGKYYHKERDCYKYEGIYYSPFSRYLVLDHETKERIHSSSRELSFGIIGIEADKYILGHYSSNIAKNGVIYLSSKIDDNEFGEIMTEVSKNGAYVIGNPPSNPPRSMRDLEMRRLDEARGMDLGVSWTSASMDSAEEVTQASGKKNANRERLVKCMDLNLFDNTWIQSSNSDRICKKEDIALYNKTYSPKFSVISAINQYDFNLAYNSEVMMGVFQKAYNDHLFQMPPKGDALARYLGNKTFGIEYESWDGRLPTHTAATNGLIPVRDGSLRHDGVCGFEYASVIMSGAKGLSAIKSQCEMLQKYAVFNEKCSVHIHVGNIPRTEENLVRLYKAFSAIQKSLYSMFPSCLQNTGAYKQKDYCSPMPALDPNANSIVKWLSDGKELFKSFGKPHPKDTSAQSKWNISSRFK